MSRRKLQFFTMLVTIVLAAVTGLTRHIPESNPAEPSARQYAPAFADDSLPWYKGERINQLGRSRGIEPFRAQSESRPSVFLPVQSKNPKSLGAGKLLVASRSLTDPIFAKTVILLAHYDSQGVVGLVLNRRTDIPLSRVFEGLKGAKDVSDLVYLGGPVETARVFGLVQSPATIEGAEHVVGGVYLITAKNLFEQTISTRPDPGVFHVYLGYAGWTDDQLRAEVQLGSWFIFPSDNTTVFKADPDSLWLQMIRKTELQFAENEPTDAHP